MPDNFIDFLRMAAHTPMLAAALLAKSLWAIRKQIFALTVVVSAAVVIWRKNRKQSYQSDGMEWHETVFACEPFPEHANCHTALTPDQWTTPTTLAEMVDTLDEEVFLAWYEERYYASQKMIEENQAKWLYAAYLLHKSQEVVEEAKD